MVFTGSSQDLLNRLIVNKTIKNELCTDLNKILTNSRIVIVISNEIKAI